MTPPQYDCWNSHDCKMTNMISGYKAVKLLANSDSRMILCNGCYEQFERLWVKRAK